MKRSKWLVVVILVFLLTGTTQAQAAQAGITGGQEETAAGDLVNFSVSITDSTGLAGYMIQLNWDTDDISLASGWGSPDVQQGDFSAAGTMLANCEDARALKVLWFNAANVRGSGQLFSVRFAVADNAAPGTYPIRVRAIQENTVDQDGSAVPVTTADGSITVRGVQTTVSQPADVANSPGDTMQAETFSDVPASHWAHESVEVLHDDGVISLTGDAFEPDDCLTRGQLAQMLSLLSGADVSACTYDGYEDVSPTVWCAPCVAWVHENGIMMGEETIFLPDAPVTRQQFAEILLRYVEVLGIKLPANPPVSFADQTQIGEEAAQAVDAMARGGLLDSQTGNLFRPNEYITRAEAADSLAKLSHAQANPTSAVPIPVIVGGGAALLALLWLILRRKKQSS